MGRKRDRNDAQSLLSEVGAMLSECFGSDGIPLLTGPASASRVLSTSSERGCGRCVLRACSLWGGGQVSAASHWHKDPSTSNPTRQPLQEEEVG